MKDPLWRDEGDFREFSPMPEEHVPATFWEVFDHTVLRPLPRMFRFDGRERAWNVNALDEVPDSSWFTNRLGRKAMTPAEAARGACDHAIDPAGPFEVIGGKPDGLNPGFLIQTRAGKKYFFKFDGADQPERATAADVIGSKIYHALGYHAPCNQIVYFDPKDLVLSPKATIKRGGKKVPMTRADVQKAFEVVKPDARGRVRGFASEFLTGKPLGPWTHEGTRDDDPNDVIPHEHRREVRGLKVVAAWTNHFDSRDQNTLTTWQDPDGDGKGYVRHHMIDFGDCFGSIWAFDEMSRRHGQTFYLKGSHVLTDLVTLGTVWRPWDRARLGPAGWTLGYYNSENFDPEEWHNGYPLPAFSEMDEGDAAWMARILADLTDAHLDAIVNEAKLANRVLDRELRRAIKGRRTKVLRRYLGRLSPLAHPRIEGDRLCLRDLAVFAGVARKRAYTAAIRGGERLAVEPSGTDRVCVRLLPGGSAVRSFVVDVETAGPSDPGPLAVHLYRTPAGYRIAGLERD